MAGHSKWAQIKRTKAVVDAKRGAVFTRLGREIMVAARSGADPAGNFQLRTAIEKAKAARMPSANIERAIAKGSGQLSGEGEQFETVRYEGYGAGGVAVLVEAFTDNRNRTAADLRLAFSKNGGNLGETGCVGYLFEQRSVVRLTSAAGQPELSEVALLESLLARHPDLIRVKGVAHLPDRLEPVAVHGAAGRLYPPVTLPPRVATDGHGRLVLIACGPVSPLTEELAITLGGYLEPAGTRRY